MEISLLNLVEQNMYASSSLNLEKNKGRNCTSENKYFIISFKS